MYTLNVVTIIQYYTWRTKHDDATMPEALVTVVGHALAVSPCNFSLILRCQMTQILYKFSYACISLLSIIFIYPDRMIVTRPLVKFSDKSSPSQVHRCHVLSSNSSVSQHQCQLQLSFEQSVLTERHGKLIVICENTNLFNRDLWEYQSI